MMELKRLLARATALLLQGAYQGAESFIEQAMAEAGKLKQEIAELDTLRTRVTEMAAEVERLQSVIDEANAQEPLTTIQVLQGYPHVASHSQCGVKDGIYKVYAERPIPAQQSPAVAVPDAYVPIHTRSGEPLWANTVVNLEQDHPSSYEMRPVYFNPSPRITEQDARPEVSYPSGKGVLAVPDPDVNGVVIVRDECGEYRRVAGTAIVKLNGDHNGK